MSLINSKKEIIMEGNDQVPSGEPTANLSEISSETESKAPGKVDYNTYQRTLGQLKSTKAKLQEFEDRVSSIEMEKKVQEEQDLMKKQQFEKLLERRNVEFEAERKRAKELEQKLQQADKDRLDSYKLNALVEKLPGKIKKKDYLGFADIDAIEVDENGKINEDSVLRVVNDFMKEHHFLVEAKGKNMPSDAPSNYTGKINYEQWKALPLKDKKKYSPKDILH